MNRIPKVATRKHAQYGQRDDDGPASQSTGEQLANSLKPITVHDNERVVVEQALEEREQQQPIPRQSELAERRHSGRATDEEVPRDFDERREGQQLLLSHLLVLHLDKHKYLNRQPDLEESRNFRLKIGYSDQVVVHFDDCQRGLFFDERYIEWFRALD